MADIQSQLPVRISNGTNDVSVTTSSALKVDGSAVTQPVSGSVSVSNLPATQPISGSVSVSNLPATQPVSGTVAVSSVGGTVAVSGTITSVMNEVSVGTIASYGTVASVAAGSTGTISYTVSAGKTLFLKQVTASSSGGPCKVVVNYGPNTPTVVVVGFYSAANPVFDTSLKQPVPIASGATVRVLITNNTLLSQDVYATIYGLEQ